MFTPVQIINLGLAKIASSQIERIDPPRTSLERFVGAGYSHWKQSEITKRRWTFAMTEYFAPAKIGEDFTRERPYQYELPPLCLRPVRTKSTEWKQNGRSVWSADSALKLTLIQNVDEAEFDPLFVEVLACRVALECAEYVTQSNTKKADASSLYDAAVAEAGQANAYTIGPEDYGSDDSDFPFITARY